MYIYVCVCVYIYVYIYVYKYLYIYIYTHPSLTPPPPVFLQWSQTFRSRCPLPRTTHGLRIVISILTLLLSIIQSHRYY